METFIGKADLHLHSKASNQPAGWFSKMLNCAESYVEPIEIYNTLRERGLDYITLTDHDTIEGVLEIAHLPNVFISCEYTVEYPEEKACLHVLVYGITEDQHKELLRLRSNLYEFLTFLKIHRIPHSLAHPFYPINGTSITKTLLEKLILLFDNWELINGTRGDSLKEIEEAILTQYNSWEKIAELEEKYKIKSLRIREKITFTAGSDDHSGLYVGSTQTLVKKAKDLESFLKGIWEGETTVYVETLDESRLFNMIAKIGYNCLEKKYIFFNEIKPFVDYLFSKPTQDDQRNFILQYFFNVNGNHDLILKAVVNKLPFIAMQKFFQTPSLQGIGEILISWLLHFVPAFLKLFYKKEEQRVLNLAQEIGMNYTYLPKIAYITDTYYDINGVAKTSQIITEIVRREKLPFTIITSSEEQRREENFLSFKGYLSFSVPFYKDFKVYLPSFLELTEYFFSEKFTQLHIATPGPLGLMSFIIGKLLGLKITFAYHTDLPQYAKIYTNDQDVENIFWKILILLINLGEKCYVPSMYYYNLLVQKGANPEKLIIFKRGVDTNLFNPNKKDKNYWSEQLKIEKNKKVILYVGRISKEKGLDKLIKIAQKLPERIFVLVGDGPYREELQSKSLSNVYFTGFKEGEDLAKAYASSDLFLFPSDTDTYALVVLEALASGLPVIISAKGGACEHIENGVNGFVVNDIDEYVEKIEFFLENPQKWEEFSKRAYQTAQNLDMHETYLQFLKKLSLL